MPFIRYTFLHHSTEYALGHYLTVFSRYAVVAIRHWKSHISVLVLYLSIEIAQKLQGVRSGLWDGCSTDVVPIAVILTLPLCSVALHILEAKTMVS